MSPDDIKYVILLVGSIGAAYVHRSFKIPHTRRLSASICGLLLMLLASGPHAVHHLIMIIVNACIIKFLGRSRHIVSFIFSFVYLIYLRVWDFCGVDFPTGQANLIQMILTLRLVGLALEVNQMSELPKLRDGPNSLEEQQLEFKYNKFQLNFMDIFHYSFNFVGLLTGPYFKYRTYKSWIETNYYLYSKPAYATWLRFQMVPIFIALFLSASYVWPISYAKSDEFYEERSWLYRYWYIWPNFFIFRMRIYTGLLLSECVCTVCGLGAYPTSCEAKSGHGPTSNFSELEKLAGTPKAAETTTFEFETIHNVNPYGADFCTTYREGMKHWNITIQYWLAANVYQRIPSKSKQMKVIVTTLVSAIWHGVYAGYYVCIGTVPMVLVLEDVWVSLKLKKNQGTSLKIWEWIIWFFKMHFFSYQAIAFILLDVHLIWAYYNSIYHAGLLLWFVLLVTGFYFKKQQKKKHRAVTETEEKKD